MNPKNKLLSLYEGFAVDITEEDFFSESLQHKKPVFHNIVVNVLKRHIKQILGNPNNSEKQDLFYNEMLELCDSI